MHVERTGEFNPQMPVSTAVDVTFDWKARAGYEGDFNPFWPEVLMSLNLKTPALYELLRNAVLELPREEDLTHAVKAQGEWTLVENVVTAEEMPELTQMVSLLLKTQS